MTQPPTPHLPIYPFALAAFAARWAGDVLLPGHPGYDDRAWPSPVLRPRNPGAFAEATAFARRHRLGLDVVGAPAGSRTAPGSSSTSRACPGSRQGAGPVARLAPELMFGEVAALLKSPRFRGRFRPAG
jgi:hypothetical protein